jgi:hypothetical protein
VAVEGCGGGRLRVKTEKKEEKEKPYGEQGGIYILFSRSSQKQNDKLQLLPLSRKIGKRQTTVIATFQERK